VNTDEKQRQSTNSSYNNTRRQFVAGSAGALGGLALGGGLVTPAVAEQDDETNGDDGTNGDDETVEPEEVDSEFEDDIDVLTFARRLELLTAAFYQQGLDNIGEEGLNEVEALEEDSYLAEVAYEELRTIQEHEETHADTLAEAIEERDGELGEEPEFDFGTAVEEPEVFLTTAVQLEDVGVSAYAGAAPFIEDDDLLPSALGIHSVEARHASFVRRLTGETGFPDAVDDPLSREEVEELASGFIVE